MNAMFTGIIRHVGRLGAVSTTPAGRKFTVDVGPIAERLAPGDSVAVNGACLTAAEVRGGEADFDVIAETLRRTTLGELRSGARVNLEPALCPADGLDGHIVQGHVDGVASVAAVRTAGGEQLWEFAAPELTGEMVAKGSVAVDGVSLTLAEVGEDRFRVALVPTTLAETTLGDLGPGDKVNVECDLIGKYVRRYLEQLSGAGGLSMDALRRSGFA